MIEMSKGKLVVTTHSWLAVDVITDIWMQVTETKGLPAVTVGDVVRETSRGYEVYRSYYASAPLTVLPTRTSLIPINIIPLEGEEE